MDTTPVEIPDEVVAAWCQGTDVDWDLAKQDVALADNSDPERLAVLDDATRERLEGKYAKAREALEGER